ncbi:hypothetical protein [Bradyrhizobium liaoningense]|uniref:hypothetical protein n=1 Tax=Bradyrhizobium liaoningense TaxID=43992 RepID=UPI0012FDBC94|nr:hypothetical protein [Bradyrhizobium liaoningense]
MNLLRKSAKFLAALISLCAAAAAAIWTYNQTSSYIATGLVSAMVCVAVSAVFNRTAERFDLEPLSQSSIVDLLTALV